MHFMQNKIQTLHSDFKNFEDVFLDWADRILRKVDNYHENGRGSVALFIENLDVNVIIFKKDFVFRGWRGNYFC